jgi:hypothetical protein
MVNPLRLCQPLGCRYNLGTIGIADDIRKAHNQVKHCSPADQASLRSNLYNYCFVNMAIFRRQFPHLWRYVRVIFSLPFATAVVESLFSRVNANKTKTRNCLREDALNGGLHAQDAVSPLDNPTTTDQPLRFFNGIVALNVCKSRDHKLGTSWGL